MATRIDPDGTTTEITPADGQTFTLQELHAIVGGYIEAMRDPDGRVLYLNEDGKRLQLPFNPVATFRLRRQLQPDDYIVGSVVLCTLAETGDDDQDDTTDEEEPA